VEIAKESMRFVIGIRWRLSECRAEMELACELCDLHPEKLAMIDFR